MDWMSLLPNEVVAEILLRLPPGDLVRSKPVCKLWYELIRSSRFAESHLRRWAARGGIACRMSFSEYDNELFYHSLDDSVVQPFNMPIGSGVESCISNFWHDSVDGGRLLDNHHFREFHVGCYDIIDSCDGLLLTSIQIHEQGFYEEVLFVCNPETSLGILLPVLDRHEMSSLGRGHIIYDPLAQKYKVVGTKYECLHDNLDKCYLIELDGGKHQSSPWKELKVPREAKKGWVITSVCIEGKLHLLKNIGIGLPLRLVSLDLTTEEFEARDCSPTPFPKRNRVCHIVGSSGMFYHTDPVSQNEFDLWSLRDLDDPVWFSRRITISSPPRPPPYCDDSFYLIEVLEDDRKFVFFSPWKSTFFIYEMTSGKCRSIPVVNAEGTTLISEGRRLMSWNTTVHVNSLISWNRRGS